MNTKILPLVLACLAGLTACGVDFIPTASATAPEATVSACQCEAPPAAPVRKLKLGHAVCDDDGLAVFVDTDGHLVPRDVQAWATDFDGDGGDAGRTSVSVNVASDGRTVTVDCDALPTWADGIEVYAFGGFAL